jgi:hypoxanthine-DNA glycosylase
VFDKESRALILGTMPSPKSREAGFYYMHPQNRFWKVIATVYAEPLPVTIEERRSLIIRHHLALWDVLNCCDITGAGDSTIRNPVPNDFSSLLTTAHITQVLCTGSTAFKLYTKLCEPQTKIKAVLLPSTSPANQGRWPFEKLVAEYSKQLLLI